MRIGVICDEQEVRLTIQTTEFCSFLSDEEKYFGQPYKRLCYNNQCGNVYKDICKSINSRYKDETSNMAIFKELKKTSF